MFNKLIGSFLSYKYAAKKTGKVIVVDESNPKCSLASEISSLISEKCFSDLKAAVIKITAPHTPVPFSPPMEDFYIPSTKKIIDAVKKSSKCNETGIVSEWIVPETKEIEEGQNHIENAVISKKRRKHSEGDENLKRVATTRLKTYDIDSGEKPARAVRLRGTALCMCVL